MEKLGLLLSLGLASSAFASGHRHDDSCDHDRVCIAVDAEGYQYLGYDDNAMEDALQKCVESSASVTSCRVSSCFGDYGFVEKFAE